ADDVALPLVEKWSGLPGERLAEAVGNKIPASVLQTLWLKAARSAFHRPVAIGYCGTQPQSAGVWHVYARNGVAEICQGLVDALPPGTVRVSTPVSAITVEGAPHERRVTGVSTAEGTQPADVVMVT